MTISARKRHVYGPVPSKRLGRSLGLDLVPFKTCTYDCIYCHLGRTTNKTIERREYAPIDAVLSELEERLRQGPAPDYLSLAGSGEPTLNSKIGDLIQAIKRTSSIPLAVLTNGSLLWMRDVQDALMGADLVIPSLDAGDAKLFEQVNRPHEGISFEAMVDGLIRFRERFAKSIWLEVLLLSGYTGTISEAEKIAAVANRIRPDRIQLNTVLRPPAEEYAAAVSSDRMRSFTRLFDGPVDALDESGVDESRFSMASSVSDNDVLALLARRPCTVQGVSVGLGLPANEAVKKLSALCDRGVIRVLRSRRNVFYSIQETKS
ncbi:MAG: radical SAM protein [Vicinamibacteria bacterium]|nr:radical SAM protein [Vicinamibacteria bacterium]